MTSTTFGRSLTRFGEIGGEGEGEDEDEDEDEDKDEDEAEGGSTAPQGRD